MYWKIKMLYLRALPRAFQLQEKLPALQKDIHLFKTTRIIFPLAFQTGIQRTYIPWWVRNPDPKQWKTKKIIADFSVQRSWAFLYCTVHVFTGIGKIGPILRGRKIYEERWMFNCCTYVGYLFGLTITEICWTFTCFSEQDNEHNEHMHHNIVRQMNYRTPNQVPLHLEVNIFLQQLSPVNRS